MTKRRAVIRLSYNLLHDLLKLPEDVVILDIYHHIPENRGEVVDVKLDGPRLPECPEGCIPLLIDTWDEASDD